jgi:hypothetical protein
MKTRSLIALASLAAAALAGPALPHGHHRTGDMIAAGVVGAAIGAALSENTRHDPVIYESGHRHDHGAGRVSPAPGVECYDASQACYYDTGGYSGKWTGRVYGN